MVTPTSIPLLLRALHLPSPKHIGIRIATADAILETATKGMPSTDKLALLTILDLGTVLGQLVEVGRGAGVQSTPEMELFREKLAKVLNGVGTELCKIIEEVNFFVALSPLSLIVSHLRPPLHQKRNTPLSLSPRHSSRCSFDSSATPETKLRRPSFLSLSPFSESTKRSERERWAPRIRPRP